MNKRCPGISTHPSAQSRPTLIQALGAFLNRGYPAEDFHLAYLGYFSSEAAFAQHLLKQAELPEQNLSEYLQQDYWQFAGHWFCRYQIAEDPDPLQPLLSKAKELKQDVNRGAISPYGAIKALLGDFPDYPDYDLAYAWNAAWELPTRSSEGQEKDIQQIKKVVAEIRARSTHKHLNQIGAHPADESHHGDNFEAATEARVCKSHYDHGELHNSKDT